MKKINQKKSLGEWAEVKACTHLKENGFEILECNYHSRYGEIDIIASREKDLIFVEVKARAKTTYGNANEVISNAKQIKIMKTAMQYLQKNVEKQSFYSRFDVICIDFSQQFAKTIQHDFSHIPYDLNWIENAFTFDSELITL